VWINFVEANTLTMTQLTEGAHCVVLPDDEKQQSDEVQEHEHIEPLLQPDDQSESGPDNLPTIHSDRHNKHHSCIWDSDEIDVLRRAFKATSDENTRLRSQVCVLQSDVEKMTTERCARRRSLESTRQRLHRAKTANNRLQMLVNHLKTELDQATNEVDRLRSVEAERNDLSCRLQKMQTQLSTADSDRETDLAAAEAKWLKVLEEHRLAETATTTQLNQEVVGLVERIEDLEQQLTQERTDHCRTRKGLEHLRIHFSSLPTSGQKSNRVYKDELANWTY